jgi:hypothetical protein
VFFAEGKEEDSLSLWKELKTNRTKKKQKTKNKKQKKNCILEMIAE